MDVRVGVERVPRSVGGGGTVLHAVPGDDRTRSAVCGSSVRRTPVPWADEAVGACPECRALLRLRHSA